jgi:predicted NAD-dependent protein-ADP-ribosyltransferase YbiA (DUF1768 family)
LKEIAFSNVDLPYGWMSTMSPYSLTYEGKLWHTAEALFQALRFDDPEIHERLRGPKSPTDCQHLAHGILKNLVKTGQLHKHVVEPLSMTDVENLEQCIRLKFEQHPPLYWPLLHTVERPIYYDLTSRGKRGANIFWGVIKREDGTWEGENIMGKIWMKIREEEIKKWKTPTPKERYAKFGLNEDPYKALKEAQSEGYEIYELFFENMMWYTNENPDFSKPVACYRIEDSF